MVDPLFPKTPICQSEVGFKKTKNGKCVGKFVRGKFFRFLFCSWVISGVYLTFFFPVLTDIHEAAFAFLPTPPCNRPSET